MEQTGGALRLSLEAVHLNQEQASQRPGLQPGPYLAIAVEGSGSGMDSQTMARIFDPFFTTKGPRGTGLGLSVAHGIAQSLGGAIEVTSTSGQGARFTVFIPQVEAAPAEEPSGLQEIPTGRERVLLVDDEEALVEIGAELLAGLGYSVESFSDSQAALNRFLANPRDFDLVITDLTMPGVSGRDLALSIWEARPGFPVLVCTGFSQADALRDLLGQGPALVLTKPLGQRELAQAVRRALAAAWG
jgi:CheY-like chemotaxis protein